MSRGILVFLFDIFDKIELVDYGMLDIFCHFGGKIANFLNGSRRYLAREDGKFARYLLREHGFFAPTSIVCANISGLDLFATLVANKRIFLMPLRHHFACAKSKSSPFANLWFARVLAL